MNLSHRLLSDNFALCLLLVSGVPTGGKLEATSAVFPRGTLDQQGATLDLSPLNSLCSRECVRFTICLSICLTFLSILDFLRAAVFLL
jgi:hypothetical protein